jgi:hypothetical protein
MVSAMWGLIVITAVLTACMIRDVARDIKGL